MLIAALCAVAITLGVSHIEVKSVSQQSFERAKLGKGTP
jgi:hypothetical protein